MPLMNNAFICSDAAATCVERRYDFVHLRRELEDAHMTRTSLRNTCMHANLARSSPIRRAVNSCAVGARERRRMSPLELLVGMLAQALNLFDLERRDDDGSMLC